MALPTGNACTQPPSGAADGVIDSHPRTTPAVRPRQASRSKGVVLKVASVLLFAVMSSLIRGFGDKVPVGQVVFFRSAFAIVPVVIIYAARGELMAALRTDHPFGHLARGVISVFGMFLFRQAMQGVPDELLQAARVDGCSELRLWWEIALPVVRPMLGAFTLMSFLAAWNSFPTRGRRPSSKRSATMLSRRVMGSVSFSSAEDLCGTLTIPLPLVAHAGVMNAYPAGGGFPTMEQRKLGRCGLRVSSLSLGAMTFGDAKQLDKVSTPEWGYPYSFIGMREPW